MKGKIKSVEPLQLKNARKILRSFYKGFSDEERHRVVDSHEALDAFIQSNDDQVLFMIGVESTLFVAKLHDLKDQYDLLKNAHIQWLYLENQKRIKVE